MEENRYQERVDAVEAVWACWTATGRELGPDRWALPTRCAGWDVTAQFAHVLMFPDGVLAAPADSAEPGPPVTAVDILTGFNASGGVAHEMAGRIAEDAICTARERGPDTLLAALGVSAPRAVGRLRSQWPADRVPWPEVPGGTTWGEAVRIVLMESVVHLLDVLDALGRPPRIPGEGLRETAHLLAEVAGPARFVEAAAGRTAEPVLPVLR